MRLSRRAFDGEQLGRLTYEALYGGLTWLGMDIAPSAMMELARKMDTTGDGHVTYEEFVAAFGPDDDWIEDDDDAASFNVGVGANVDDARRDDSDIFGVVAAAAAATSSGGASSNSNPLAGYDPLGALGGGDADGWGGDEDLIQFDGAAGAGRARITARSLTDTPASVRASPVKVGPQPVVSSAGATLGVPLSRDVLSGFRLALRQHSAFTKTWTSEATGTRRTASFWSPKIEASVMARNRDRICLGSYAVPGYNDPSRVAGQPANTVEIADSKSWAVTGSAHMPKIVDALFPHPVRFRQVWGQDWKHASAYAWAAVPPPGFSALGMVLTNSADPPPLESTRCVPTAWTCEPQTPPKLVWENGGSGGRPASVWVVNSLGTAHVVVGHEPPLRGDVLELKPAAELLPENLLAPEGAAAATTANRPALRGRAAMFESVAAEQQSKMAEAEARFQRAKMQSSSGNDLLTGAMDLFTGGAAATTTDQTVAQTPHQPQPQPHQQAPAFAPQRAPQPRSNTTGGYGALDDDRPLSTGDGSFLDLLSGATTGPSAQSQPARQTFKPVIAPPKLAPPPAGAKPADVNPFARMDPARTPASSGTVDLLTGTPLAAPAAPPPPPAPVDPLGTIDPLGAGNIRVKKEGSSFFGGAAARQTKKKD